MKQKTIALTLFILAVCQWSSPLFAQKTDLLILPTIHSGHKKNVNYTFENVSNIIKNFKPDIIAVEIRPEDMDQDTVYLKQFYQPEMIMAKNAFPGVRKVGIDFMGNDMVGKHLPASFNQDTTGDMGKFRLANSKLMRDSAIIRARINKGLVALKTKQGQMMSTLSASQLLDGSYDRVTDEYTRGQTAVLTNTPYQYYDTFSISRDQKIAENIRDLAIKNPGKRIIVLSGANHHNRAVQVSAKVRSINLVREVNDK